MQQDSPEFADSNPEDALFTAPPSPAIAQLKKESPERERGATLMFALAILALLVLFSTVFARLMSIERRASAYYRDRVRSKLAARAGIERAIVELRAVAGQNHYSDPYQGRWKYWADNTTRPTNLPATEPVDLLTTNYPSFRQVHPTPLQRWGDQLVYSGYLGQPDDTSHMVYRLKVIDSGSQLNLNHPDQQTANRLLRNLLVSTFDDANDGGGSLSDPDLDLSLAQATAIADAVIPLRTGGTTGTLIEQVEDRFRSKPQLGAAIIEAAVNLAANPVDAELMESEWIQHLRDKVTVYSWEDPDVIRPYGLNTENGADALQARRNLPLMARAPVNLNTASAPVLYALFAGLRAKTRYGTFEIDDTTAQTLAARIIARRADPLPGASSTGFNPFKSWPEFEAWLDDPAQNDIFSGLPATLDDRMQWGSVDLAGGAWGASSVFWAPQPSETITGAEGLIGRLQRLYRIGHRDLIKAQLNPNTMLNKYGALPTHGGNRRRYARIVDKSDLTRMTTEGCFDSLGVFEITSTGIILTKDVRDPDRGHLVSAGHTDLVVVRVYSPFRLTTQSQFEKHRANMIKGNFIVAPEKQDATKYDINDSFSASVNKAAYFNTSVPITDKDHMIPGWSGMVSWPQYSLKRVDTAADSQGANKTFRYPLYDSANPATWDGHMTLSNMITVRTGDNDFVAGFSRGKLEAFKVRAWWEPKDVDPAGQYRQPQPTRPTNATELAYLANSLARGTQAPASVDPSGLESVLAEDFNNAGMTMEDASLMFTEGASLLNTGVMIGPDRGNRFLAYDSNNIDLKQGTSIRFWVQPLADPYAKEKEILFYFNGSNGSKPGNQSADPDYSGWNVPTRTGTAPEATPRHGNEQQAGFVVYKEHDPGSGKIVIRLEDLGTNEYSYAQTPTVTVDVTPSIMLPPATGSSELKKPDPAKPEWIPGSWHWIVINIGPGQLNSGDGRRTAFASLQVDKRTVLVQGAGAKQLFRGSNARDSTTGAAFADLGEVHAYKEQHGDSDISSYVSAVHAGNSLSTPGALTFWRIYPRMLGDFYHCTQYDTLSTTPNSVPPPTPDQGPGWNEGGSRHGLGTVSYRRTVEFGAPGGAPAMQYSGSKWWWYNWTAGGLPGWYIQGAGWPAGPPFPALCTNRAMNLQFYAPGGGLAGVPLMPFSFTGGGWTAEWPSIKVPAPSPFGYENGTSDYDDAPNPRGVNAAGLARYPYPGGKEWHMSLLVSWDEVHYLGRSPWAAQPWPGGGGYRSGWLPTDLAQLDMVDHPDVVTDPPRPDPDWEARGGRLPYALDTSARHNKNTSMTTQVGSPTTPLPLLVDGTFPGYIRGRERMRFTGLAGAALLPLDTIDDDCHGCEDCDLDGPVLFGAEPAGSTNYNGTAMAAPDLDTMAVAVFDNIVFVNQDADRRTDFPGITSTGGDLFGGPGGTVSLVAKDFEDRFYEEDLAQYLDEIAGAGAKGTGAVFHRGLLELRNRQFRLSSMTWTSYPTRVTNLDFEVALWKIDNGPDGSGEPTYRYSNDTLIETQRDAPDLGDFSTTTNFATNPGKGAVFGHPNFAQRKLSFLTDFFQPNATVNTTQMLRSPFVDGLGAASAGIPPELLILGVRLQGYTNSHLDDGDTTVDDPESPNEATPDQGVLVSPVLETPVFEDVTLNLTFPRPQYLYAEEGAIE